MPDTAMQDIVQVARVTDPEDLRTHLPGVILQVTPLPPSRLEVSSVTLRMGDLVLQCGVTSPMILIASVGPGIVALQFSLHADAAPVVNGRSIQENGFGLYTGGARVVRSSPVENRYAVLTMRQETATAQLDLPRPTVAGQPSGEALLTGRAADWLRITRLMAAAAEVASHSPAIFATEAPRVALRASLLGAAHELLAGAEPRPEEHRPLTQNAWRRIVLGAESYLTTHLDRPIYTEELCSVLGVSAATMAEAFRATLGMSPHRYLKLRRLHMVRAVLQHHDGAPPLVKAVALSHGFWHLGQFAHDYRALFGETPSETLAAVAGCAATETVEVAAVAMAPTAPRVQRVAGTR